ncbi:MAG: hypothetical protein HON53_01090 [Planctomycetaceae bacterium]|nr:hypothetical protein [Planctomycetaceae bacterium]MBT6156835.1 hypothetical protein [Planctomycetaceae bacterium]MBT6484147.1 hypothetical protein [Planctomycetaceae bacterium]
MPPESVAWMPPPLFELAAGWGNELHLKSMLLSSPKPSRDLPCPFPRKVFSMRSFLLTVCRFSMAAWVGGAALFVVTSVIEQSGPNFDSEIRDHLALMRFPFYYGFGFSLLGVGLLSGLAACGHPSVSKKIATAFFACASLAMILMVVDYVWIYQPLVELITPAGSAKSAEFVTYHKASKYINEIDLTLCLVAALAICWPLGTQSQAKTDSQ